MREKKFLDEQGLIYLWKLISLQDYPNNDTLIAVINAIDENKADKTTTDSLQDSIDILNGTGEGSVRNIVTNAVATIVAQAPEDFDTLKEIADWIANDEIGTINLINKVEENRKNIQNSIPKKTTITLLASNWTGNSNPYSQEISINGITENSKIDLFPTAVQIVDLQNTEITLMLQNDSGTVTAWAIGNKPTKDYTMQVLIQEVTPV